MNVHLPKYLRRKQSREIRNILNETYEKCYESQKKMWDAALIDRKWVSKEWALKYWPEKEES